MHLRLRILLLPLMCIFSSACIAQSTVTITSDADDLSRPISALLDQLRQREHISVTYEDPRYSNGADIEDVTEQVARNVSDAEKKLHRILVPRGRAISFVYAPDDLRAPDGAKATIARMLREYRLLGGPTFNVVRDGKRLHVVPEDRLDVKGNRIKQNSILDTIISIPAKQRDGGELLQAICDEVKKQSGYEIGVGPSAPSNNLARYVTTEGISKQTAENAVENLLDRLGAPDSFDWDLYYDPGDKAYGLNFNYIGPAQGPTSE